MPLICRKCRADFRRKALEAMLVDLGCEVYPRPTDCPEGGDHNFVEPEHLEEEENDSD